MTSNVYSLFAARADVQPNAIAICGEDTVTYGELRERADRIAHFIRGQGLVAEASIGVLMSRSADMVAALLGILKTGASFVPCEPEHPPARINRIFDAARCSLVVVDAKTAWLLDKRSGLMRAESVLADVVADREPISEGGSRLAYTMFVSGSLGHPVGVQVEHSSLLHCLQTSRRIFDFRASDCFLGTTSIALDPAMVEIFLPLVSGGRLLLTACAALMDAPGLSYMMRRHNVTVAQASPTVWDHILNTAGGLPPLKVLISTGEGLSPALARRLAASAGRAWNLYGPTEATVWATRRALTSETDDRGASAPLGVAFGNAKLRVKSEWSGEDSDLGELWVGGAGVARGYSGEPELTRRRFVLDAKGGRWFRTGVRVQRVDAELHFLGRMDDHVQVNGMRVEPREVEQVLATLENVAFAAATWYSRSDASRAIGAIVKVVDDKGPTTVPHLYHDLALVLPGAMLPSRIVLVDNLPVGANGSPERHDVRRRLLEVEPTVYVDPDVLATEKSTGGLAALTGPASKL